jgi:hypothetical protein
VDYKQIFKLAISKPSQDFVDMPSRYFVNHLAEFVATESASAFLNQNRQKYKEQLLETASLCVQKFASTCRSIRHIASGM